MCGLDRDFVLLENPTETLSEGQEAQVFRLLRSELRADQVVLVSASKFAAAAYAEGASLGTGGTSGTLFDVAGAARELVLTAATVRGS